MNRGDVLIAAIPNADGSPAKNRPVLVVQSDYYNQRIKNVLVAQITSNLSCKSDAAHLLIEVATPEGKLSGLNSDSLVSVINISVLTPQSIRGKIGELSQPLMQQVDACIKQAFGL
jgi:mRNA interferase MazF